MEEDVDVSPSFDSADHFWAALQTIIASPCDTHERIDDTLRSWIALITSFKHDYLQGEDEVARCCYDLLDSDLYQANTEYVRRQFVHALLQEDEAAVLHIVAAFLLFDGRSNESTFQMMQDEGTFVRLMDLIKSRLEDDATLHRLLLELLCEMSRIQPMSCDDLGHVDDAFILYLFQLIEQLSDDASDPYHYPVIRILLVLNEQYMCFATASDSPTAGKPLINRIIKLLSAHGPSYRTFGENLILLLNREAGLGPQLLILKLLYYLFTTPQTYEYFYTNDLHVLVDVIMRNLLDLDQGYDEQVEREGGGQRALRHTYLRVLCPLLRNTQLASQDGHYKREELRKMFYLMVHSSSLHFAPVDNTIVRLVTRCKQIEWIRDERDNHPHAGTRTVSTGEIPTDKDVAKKLLGMNLAAAAESSLSIIDVAAKVEKERPLVPAPRRRKRTQQGLTAEPAAMLTPPVVDDALTSSTEPLGGRSPFADDHNE